jgi:hypothetical protein
MQDRILGPLTMIQFIYAVVGGGFCYAIYMSPIPKPFSYVLIIPIALLVLALDFLKINERPFLDFLLSVLQFTSVPRQRLWHHEDLPDLKVEVFEPPKAKAPVAHNKHISREEIENLAQKLDQGNN